MTGSRPPASQPSDHPVAAEQICAKVTERLQGQQQEFEREVLIRVHEVADPEEVLDLDYVDGLRSAVKAALGLGIEMLGWEEEGSPPAPGPLLVQVRRAARNGVSLDIVLRRYYAAFALFVDLIVRETEEDPGLADGLRQVLRDQAFHLDRLVAEIGDAYAHEREEWLRSPQQQRVDQVKRLLGEETDRSDELSYELECWHLAAIASGPRAEQAVRKLAAGLDRRLLVIQPEERTVWAWLGGAREIDSDQLDQLAGAGCPAPTCLALGEPGEGVAGWRLSHHQARTAVLAAQREPGRAVRYADVAVATAMLKDEVLLASLRRLYLEPLNAGRIGGAASRETLRSFFAADCNVSSAAAALGLSRHTVANRIRAIEERLGRPLSSCRVELELALRVESLDLPELSREAA